jgi:putative membrane protein
MLFSRESTPQHRLAPGLKMPPKLKEFLQRWLITTAAVLVASAIVSGIQYQKPLDLIAAALLLGVLNAFVRPLLFWLSLPLVIFSLGLFMLVINALLLEFTGWLLAPHFSVAGFGPAFLGALIISIISLILNILTGTGRSRIHFHRAVPPRNPPDDPGGGPVIDV